MNGALPLLSGIDELRLETRGSPVVCAAIVDGSVATEHPCLRTAVLQPRPHRHAGAITAGSRAGTHAASLIFGQPDTVVEGIAPGCRGLLVPVYGDKPRLVPATELARAIDRAGAAGAHIMAIGSGLAAPTVIDHAAVQQAVARSRAQGAVICWDLLDRTDGILAQDTSAVGAAPDGGLAAMTGDVLATPIVAGVLALMLSLQHAYGVPRAPAWLKQRLLAGMMSCPRHGPSDAASALSNLMLTVTDMVRSYQHRTLHDYLEARPDGARAESSPAPGRPSSSGLVPSATAAATEVGDSETSATPGPVYALGTLGFDFATGARRDAFRQRMNALDTLLGGPPTANPYDARQMTAFLRRNLSESRFLTWTFHIEKRPVYAVVPTGEFVRDVHAALLQLLTGQLAPEGSPAHVERMSLPGRLTARTVRLLSGRELPIVEVDSTKGLTGWSTSRLIEEAVAALPDQPNDRRIRSVRASLRAFFDRAYLEAGNPGRGQRERALNFAVTDVLQSPSMIAQAAEAAMELAELDISKSPVERQDGDCWNVRMVLFDPVHSSRPKRVFQTSLDIGESVPTPASEVRSWVEPAPAAAMPMALSGPPAGLQITIYNQGGPRKEHIVITNASPRPVDLMGIAVAVPTAQERAKNRRYVFEESTELDPWDSVRIEVYPSDDPATRSFGSRLALLHDDRVCTVQLQFNGEAFASETIAPDGPGAGAT